MDIFSDMLLKTYLKDNGLTYAEFALEIEVATAKTVQRYAEHDRFPRTAILRRIEVATGGAVTAADFVPEATAA